MLNILEFGNMGDKGLNTDLSPWSLPPEFLTAGKNFRVAGGKIISSGSWDKISSVTTPGYLAKGVSVSSDIGNTALIASEMGVLCWDGNNWESLLTLTQPVVGSLWTFARMGGIPIVAHPDVGIFYWNPVRTPTDPNDAATIFQYLPYDKTTLWDDPSIRTGNVIRNHKTFLFLLNLTENGVNMPDSFRWSHPASINSIPPTWDAESPDAQFFMAGIASLGSNSGPIIDGLSLRDSFVLYSDNSINVLQEVGLPDVWNRRELTSYTGILAVDCVCEVKGAHFLMTGDDIIVNDGNSLNSIMHNRIRSHYAANLSQARYADSFVVSNLVKKEIWFCIPTDKKGIAVDMAYIYNWKDDSWAIRDLQPNTAFAYYGPNAKGDLTWDSLKQRNNMPWSTAAMSWNSDRTSPFEDSIVGIANTGEIYDLDPLSFVGTIAAEDSKLEDDMFIERTNISFGDQRSKTTLVSAYIHTEGSGTLLVKFGSHDFVGSPVRWKQAVTFDVGGQRKVNVRTTGELHAFRIETIGVVSCTITGMTLEFAQAGLR